MTNFAGESWTFYAVVTCMVVARFTARLLHFKSVLKLQIEDWLMAFIFGLYTVLIVFLNIDLNVNTNLIPPNAHLDLTPHDIKERTWGSKTVLLVEQCMCGVQWGTKACLLLLYWRLTQNLTQGYVVKAVSAYVALTYVIMEIFYFAVWCRPFHDYWQTPTSNYQCPTALHHLIMNLSFNLSSDLMIMSIPLPLILRAHLNLKKKVLLAFPFSLGFFTIACAISSKVESFEHPYSSVWVFWYCREASTAMIVTNMPYSWALIRRIFRLKSFFSNSDQNATQAQAGQMQTISGHSLGGMTTDKPRQESSATSKGNKRFFQIPRTIGKKRSSLSGDAILEEGRQSTPNTLEKKDVNVETGFASASNSSAECSPIQIPHASSAAAAVDKLYRLDDDDLERPEEAFGTRRMYNS